MRTFGIIEEYVVIFMSVIQRYRKERCCIFCLSECSAAMLGRSKGEVVHFDLFLKNYSVTSFNHFKTIHFM